LPGIIFGIGLAILIAGERAKDRPEAGVLRIIGVLVIIFSLIFIGAASCFREV
jgi:hypothetical protein